MNKLMSAVEHHTNRADALFDGELCDIPPYFSVNCTDQMYQGNKSTILGRLLSCQPPSGYRVISKVLILEASLLSCKLANVGAPNFHEFGISFTIILNRLRISLIELTLSLIITPNSVKAQTRQGRGAEGTRVREISDDTTFLKDFPNSFLCIMPIIITICDYVLLPSWHH